MQKMKCVISGSFHKFFDDIQKTISDFEKLGITVLAPEESKAINTGEEFVVLESDATNDIKALETKHLNAIRECDFLYVYNPDGYIGNSTVLEIGFALACGKKVHCLERPSDIVIAEFINNIGTPKEIL